MGDKSPRSIKKKKRAIESASLTTAIPTGTPAAKKNK